MWAHPTGHHYTSSLQVALDQSLPFLFHPTHSPYHKVPPSSTSTTITRSLNTRIFDTRRPSWLQSPPTLPIPLPQPSKQPLLPSIPQELPTRRSTTPPPAL